MTEQADDTIRVVRRSIGASGRMVVDRPFVVFIGDQILRDKRDIPKRFSSPSKARAAAIGARDAAATLANDPGQPQPVDPRKP